MLQYQPKPGSIVRCDFSGFVEPEMIKKRPVIVIHVHKTNSRLVTIVPISATKPDPLQVYHKELDFSQEPSMDLYMDSRKRWFKCDMVYVVSIDRLDRYKNRITGDRNCPIVSSQTLKTIREMTRLVNGM